MTAIRCNQPSPGSWLLTLGAAQARCAVLVSRQRPAFPRKLAADAGSWPRQGAQCWSPGSGLKPDEPWGVGILLLSPDLSSSLASVVPVPMSPLADDGVRWREASICI